MWGDNGVAKLAGLKVETVSINQEKDLILITGERGGKKEELHLSAVGDCCSRSWFEHIEGLDALIGQEVREVVDRKMPDSKEDENGHEYIKFYGWSLVTPRGRCELEMRNSSNGYYGGWVECSEQPIGQYGLKREGDETKTAPVLVDF